METFAEAVLISADALILSYFLKKYFDAKRSVNLLETAPNLKLDADFARSIVENGGTLPYATLRGNVAALSPPIHSFNAPSVTGVVQKVTVREHVVSQGRSGFWIDDKRLINSVVNSVPFAIKSSDGTFEVEVVDALRAKVLDLEVVADRFDPAPSNFLQNLWQLATGERKQGVQTKEELLKEGTLVTVVGELVGKPGYMSIAPPQDGTPFFITTMPLPGLVRRLGSDISFHKWMSISFGVITALTCSYIIFKHWRSYSKKAMDKRQVRRGRRKRVRQPEELSDDKICVVCQVNPKEIVLIPCGHVCLCEDCSDRISDVCPICKQAIVSKNDAYI